MLATSNYANHLLEGTLGWKSRYSCVSRICHMSSLSVKNRLFLYIRTASYLKLTQAAFLILRRVFPSRALRPSNCAISLRQGVRLLCKPIPAMSSGSDANFRFLNAAKTFNGEDIDWKSAEMPKLWRYNLHYFDYLLDKDRSLQNKRRLISHWIARNPLGTEDAWEPYTASLRVVNWIKYFLLLNVAGFEERSEKLPRREWIESLCQQALWLEQNIEYHILANHYLKNGVALFFAGMYFEGIDADRWLRKGLGILRAELKEQFLADGGHFERSPMYHSICLVDYLDVLNLAQHSSSEIPCEITDEFTGKVTAALDFLSGICLPDGAIPLFNDSAFAIAPTPHQIFDYAERVIGYKAPSLSNGLVVSAFPSSGYYVCRKAGDMMVMDCGPIGPDYQPGHAHCDTLSFELVIEGRRVIVDSGVYDYEPSLERAYARSTKAHNTVRVEGVEQSEIWGVFRVARRAKPCESHIEQMSDGSVLFTGAHDGYTRLPGKPIHKRSVTFDGKGSWRIEDRLEGEGHHRIESYLHIHPDYEVVLKGTSLQLLRSLDSTIAVLEPLEAEYVNVEQGWYFPEFGLKCENHVVILACTGNLPLNLSYRIRKMPTWHF